MKRLLKSPAVNAMCISVFTAFYALIFMLQANRADFAQRFLYEGASSFWIAWSGFLLARYHIYLAWGLVAITVAVVVLLYSRKKPYDEYHVSILMGCLVVAAVLTLVAIAVFYLVVLYEPVWIVGKFTLFIVIHWSTVALSNLAYILLCRWR